MSDGNGGTHNTAAYSNVGIQAETVHNSQVYIVSPDASPEEKYRVGVRFLEEGVPNRARDLIGEAIAHGHDTAEVRFHWVLAMLSARAYHDLDAGELQRLRAAADSVGHYPEGEWKDALCIAFDLLSVLRAADTRTASALERLRSLPPRRREAILRHLDLVLAGALKDSLWAEHRERAEAERFGNDRVDRVWAYFEPEPIGPRALPPRPGGGEAARMAVRLRATVAAVATAVFLLLTLAADPVEAVLRSLVAIGAAAAAAHFGRAWWQEKHRRETGNGGSAASPRGSAASPRGSADTGEGFTRAVRRSVDHCFGARVPRGLTHRAWMDLTDLIRDDVADEIAVLYRESRVGVERVDWLIRHLAEDTRDRYAEGTLFDEPSAESVPMTAKALCVLAVGVLGLTTLSLLGTLLSGSGGSSLLLGILALVVVVRFGRRAAVAWLEAEAEERRLAEGNRLHQEQLAGRQAAYQEWKSYLDAMRPTELEMETWLACDRTLFVDEALRHYQLTWSDLITHTILVTPARPYKRGRVRGGPWRYSRYSFRLFLITADGVREISTEFDFTDAERGNEQRSNYRFDALSSVQVTENADIGYDLELVLTNGPARNIRVKDADTHQLAPDENAREIAEINLNAAGFVHTFRLLEGIAADGKGWIERNNPHNLSPFRAPV
ncbi:hypothetical protein [Streptomyces sp. MJP52]|uniref:hypothetical protein n=1 Tax=Streptomyces sp. MJP52 TaxID=2940555 RepID=UPI00247597C3|nr:hypothetical protein [Streptomyces sp. MJP52]MDH6225667.1 hypothetical protein [Streptomyces sp. MJP52]